MAKTTTPIRTVRIDDELWTAVQAQAKADGVTVTSIIVNGLLQYLTNARITSVTEGTSHGIRRSD